jgi:hypothetical protein
MPQHDTITVTGTVTDIFAHRFVIETSSGRILADLTPKGAELIVVRVGDLVTLTGEMKPSELKIARYTKDGEQPLTIDHGPPRHEVEADPAAAIKEARNKGYTPLGSPRRKPKHFEILGRSQDGELHELHLEFDGHLRKSKPVDADDPKWAAELAQFTSS